MSSENVIGFEKTTLHARSIVVVAVTVVESRKQEFPFTTFVVQLQTTQGGIAVFLAVGCSLQYQEVLITTSSAKTIWLPKFTQQSINTLCAG